MTGKLAHPVGRHAGGQPGIPIVKDTTEQELRRESPGRTHGRGSKYRPSTVTGEIFPSWSLSNSIAPSQTLDWAKDNRSCRHALRKLHLDESTLLTS